MSEPSLAAGVRVSGQVELGATESFEAFFDAESAALFRRLCLITGDRAEAEDIMQDAFLKLWERWDRVPQMDDPTGYLYRTAMNLFRKRYRHAAVVARKAVGLAPRRDEFADADDKRVVARALATLAPRQRAALVLTELVGYSSEEAGRVLGIRAGTVRALATQGRDVLRRTMERDDG
jgi:RNA polymerase sigma-70 factor (ECF subfamily)